MDISSTTKDYLLRKNPPIMSMEEAYRYINEFKSMFNNFIIEPNVSNNEIFKANSILLKHAPKNTFLAVGELTNYISLFVNNVQIEDSDIVDENKFVENDELDSNVDCADGIEENDLADNAFDNLENDLEDDLNESVSSDMPERKFTVEEIEQKSSEIINNVAKNIDNDSNLTDVSIFDEVEESNADVIVENSLLELENNTDKTSEDFVDVEINENTKVETNIDSENGENSFSVNVENVLLEDSNVLLDEEIASVVDDAQVSTLDNINADNDDLATVSEEVAELDMIKDEQVSNNQDAVVSDCENSFIVENSFDEDISAIKDSEVESSLSEFNDDSQIVEISEDYDILSDYDDELLESNNDNVMVDFEAAQAEEEIKTLDDYGNFGVLSLTDENENNEIDSIVEVSDDSNFEPDVIVEIDDYDNSSEVEDLDKAIKEDVDRVFTTIKDDSLSDSDLDFIDELNNNTYEDLITEGSYEELPELVEQEEESLEISPVVEVNEGLDDDEQILETKTSTTPIIPVYDADIPNEDLVVSDVIEQGDSVLHAKYGNGIVEKMIKYGTKTLYSINFDNVGRRLLDPNLTEIKKCK